MGLMPMSMLKNAWLNLAKTLWEREVVEKLDAFQQEYDAAGGGQFLSSVVDDTAAGVITFTPTPVTTAAAPTQPAELTRKDYVDGADSAHAALTAAGDNVHDVQGLLGPYARKDQSNLFTAYPQSIRSDGPTGLPEFALENSLGVETLSIFYSELASEDRVNIIAWDRPLFLQNRDPGGPLPGVVVGDNNVVPTTPPGTLTVEVDVLIGGAQVSVNAVVTDYNNNAPFARLGGDNDFVAPNQSIQSQSGTDRPAWRIKASATNVVGEFYYAESTDKLNILGYGGRPVHMQPGASAGVTVGNNALTAAAGVLHAAVDLLYGGVSVKSHVDDTSIHFADAPSDGNRYVRRNGAWEILP